MIEVGTRKRNNWLQGVRPQQGRQAQGYTRDLGMTKNNTGSFTFVNSVTQQIQGANGSFPSFVLNDVVLVEGTNLNNGYFTVVAIDATNHAFLTLSPGVQNEGPVTCTIRTA